MNAFLNLLRALFSCGNAHIADRLKQGPPDTRPYSFGWRKSEIHGFEPVHEQYHPMGDCIGWYCDKERQVWLDQDSTFAKVQQLASTQGDKFLISPSTLWRRMGDKGLIIQSEVRENGGKRWSVKKPLPVSISGLWCCPLMWSKVERKNIRGGYIMFRGKW